MQEEPQAQLPVLLLCWDLWTSCWIPIFSAQLCVP